MNSDTKSIAIACKKFDLHPEIFACSASELRKMQLPCLIYWKLDRFVVLIEMDEYYFYVLDPAHNQIEFSFDDFECYFCEEGVSFRGSIKNENLLRTED
jgi:ABC-type bacteriocin/lantibiotic exporter with double-glycine peptidase domain